MFMKENCSFALSKKLQVTQPYSIHAEDNSKIKMGSTQEQMNMVMNIKIIVLWFTKNLNKNNIL